MTKGNEPAFPATPNDAKTGEDCYFEGLTKREYFAAKAMQGILSDAEMYRVVVNTAEQQGIEPSQATAELACDFSNALLNELKNG